MAATVAKQATPSKWLQWRRGLGTAVELEACGAGTMCHAEVLGSSTSGTQAPSR